MEESFKQTIEASKMKYKKRMRKQKISAKIVSGKELRYSKLLPSVNIQFNVQNTISSKNHKAHGHGRSDQQKIQDVTQSRQHKNMQTKKSISKSAKRFMCHIKLLRGQHEFISHKITNIHSREQQLLAYDRPLITTSSQRYVQS